MNHSTDIIIPVERLDACGKKCVTDGSLCGKIGICQCHTLENLKKPDSEIDKSASEKTGGIFK